MLVKPRGPGLQSGWHRDGRRYTIFCRILVHAMGTHKEIADKWGRLKSKLNSDRFGVKESFEAELANL